MVVLCGDLLPRTRTGMKMFPSLGMAQSLLGSPAAPTGWIQALAVDPLTPGVSMLAQLPFLSAADEKHLLGSCKSLAPVVGCPSQPGSRSSTTFGLYCSLLFSSGIQLCLESSEFFFFWCVCVLFSSQVFSTSITSPCLLQDHLHKHALSPRGKVQELKPAPLRARL